MMRANLRGELTLYKDEEMQQFSVRDNELIDAVASHFKVGSTEVRKHSQSKVLSCDSNTTQPLHRLFFNLRIQQSLISPAIWGGCVHRLIFNVLVTHSTAMTF